MDIGPEQFEDIVAEAIDSLPERFQKKMNNVAIMVEDFASQEQLEGLNIRSKYGLLGMYEGHVQSSRRNMGPVLPDRIYIYRVPIMQSCDTISGCRQQIINTVKHEIAHHFGSDEPGARKAGTRKN